MIEKKITFFFLMKLLERGKGETRQLLIISCYHSAITATKANIVTRKIFLEQDSFLFDIQT